jgi:hypothetical protein
MPLGCLTPTHTSRTSSTVQTSQGVVPNSTALTPSGLAHPWLCHQDQLHCVVQARLRASSWILQPMKGLGQLTVFLWLLGEQSKLPASIGKGGGDRAHSHSSHSEHLMAEDWWRHLSLAYTLRAIFTWTLTNRVNSAVISMLRAGPSLWVLRQSLLFLAHDPVGSLPYCQRWQGMWSITSALLPSHGRWVVGSAFQHSCPQDCSLTPLLPRLAPLCCLIQAQGLFSWVLPLLRDGPALQSTPCQWRMGPVLHSPWTCMWSPMAALIMDIPMFTTGHMNHRHPHRHLTLCSHSLRHGPQWQLRLEPHHGSR